MSKNITAGEGGILLTDQEEIATPRAATRIAGAAKAARGMSTSASAATCG